MQPDSLHRLTFSFLMNTCLLILQMGIAAAYLMPHRFGLMSLPKGHLLNLIARIEAFRH